ncbi:endoplasmic reticulum-Golgi intermediate compartment protein 2 [Nilaparvata lugens]|uniref:endoplasmic reticulum-Golgi intermediate compartment protein 2 n=1 Tax=Nilaparvata lugens TaxID=108931 RepID=UPI000B9864BB|nr:endoplasmic reticulum-Golgi intermediate compartment protein 2 [Nilaparvata lugens]XP_022192384.1 endoplasmic reticulum-Golgi intermediate compartment protein 2 [Nilaparvata lugens]XP_039279700.1 endoplasmic reticulum-Golgi intermediate compartment protein 2 [Nilaparvata lugens]
MLRSRKNKLAETVKEFDTFNKLPESFVESSRVGGTFTLITLTLITWLVYSEIRYYFDNRFIFKFSPDTDYDGKIKLNIDITVAMPCQNVGADILDSTNQNVMMFGNLEEENTWFELSLEQRRHFDNVRHFNMYLREQFHAIQDLLWKSRQVQYYGDPPTRKYMPVTPPDACRLHGTLELNKVAGNFHITAGKSLSLPRGHIHISAFMWDNDYNFTHRINKLSFGDPSPGIIHPLEGDEKVTTENMALFQYFIEVVPTDVQTFMTHTQTYQYSVKDHLRLVDHHKGSHGVPGIFFKYDMSALKVSVSEEREPLDQFFVRLCATVCGIFVTTGLINSFIQFVLRLFNCQRGVSSATTGADIINNISVIEPEPLIER